MPARSRPRIGAGFGRLWTASAAGNLGDGVGRVAIALFAARLTRDPMAVAAVTALSYLPWLAFGLPAGVLVDRYDRRRLAMLAAGVRGAAIAVLTAAAATDRASLWLLYAVVLLLFTCETVYDNSVSAMVPMVVADPGDLERANGRMQGAKMVADNFLGPPLAGIIFALAAAYAFGVTAACYLAAGLLFLALPGSYRAGHERDAPPSPPRSMRGEISEAIRYVRGHRLHRSLLGLLMVLGFGGAMVNATMVLWVQDVLGVTEALYGVFGLTIATGALAGSQTAAALARRLGRARTMRVGIAACGVGALTAAATGSPYAAGAGLVVVGWGTLVFNVVNASTRQRLTPPTLLGRVTGLYLGAAVGVMVLGAVVGGAVATLGGLRLPWLGFGLGCLALSAWMARRLTNDDLDHEGVDADGTLVRGRAAGAHPERSWLDARVVVGDSPIQGQGLFTTAPVRAGEMVAVIGGGPIDDEALAAIDASGQTYSSITVAGGLHLLLDPAHPIRYGNHSCAPNLWLAGATTLVARFDIPAGEELTQDYATYTGVESWQMPCRCGGAGCRGVVSGQDWRSPQLRRAYGERWAPPLLDRIRELEDGHRS